MKLDIVFLIPNALNAFLGSAIAQAIGRRLPTAAARMRSKVKSYGICGGQSGTVASFLRLLPFPLPILIPPDVPFSSLIRGCTIVQLVADVPSGLSLNPSYKEKAKLFFVVQGRNPSFPFVLLPRLALWLLYFCFSFAVM
jgi:hypothetical protein